MYAQFDYVVPSSCDELFALLDQQNKKSLLYAGGTDLLVFLRAKKVEATRLIDIKQIPSFHEITKSENSIRIGCAVTLTEISESHLVQQWVPALADGVQHIGSVQIRNKGTLAGNIQTASPAADGLNAAWGLDAMLVLRSSAGERRIPLQEYVLAPRKTAIAPNELLASIEIPHQRWDYQSFFKVGRRNALAISVVNGLVALSFDAHGTIQDARISVGAVGPTPLRLTNVEQLLLGKNISRESAAEARRLVCRSVSPISDLRASAEYRTYMAGTMVWQQLLRFQPD